MNEWLATNDSRRFGVLGSEPADGVFSIGQPGLHPSRSEQPGVLGPFRTKRSGRIQCRSVERRHRRSHV